MSRQRPLHRLFLAACLAAVSVQAPAYVCQGVVKGVSVDSSGDLLVASVGTSMTWPRFCNVGQSANGVAPAACKAHYSMLLTSQTTGRSVTVWIQGDANDTNACATLAAWQYVPGFYFLTLND
jgi:hypothetical protein